jgi:hypothetical protein
VAVLNRASSRAACTSPGRSPGQTFESPADSNTQTTVAAAGEQPPQKRSLCCAPADRIGADNAQMMALPPVPPVSGLEMTDRLARDHYVRLDSNDYSVHPSAVGRRIMTRLTWTGCECDGTGRRLLDRTRLPCEDDRDVASARPFQSCPLFLGTNSHAQGRETRQRLPGHYRLSWSMRVLVSDSSQPSTALPDSTLKISIQVVVTTRPLAG